MADPIGNGPEQDVSVSSRMQRVSGSPRQIGCQLGRTIGRRLETTIADYIAQGPARFGIVDWHRLDQRAKHWLDTLPERFVDEMEGLAEGSGVSLQRIAEWSFIESCVSYGCSTVLTEHLGRTWVAHNNDLWVPALWGYATTRDIVCDDRMPTLLLGMEGETFSVTGMNKERLWLHCHFLPTRDRPIAGKPAQDFFVWLTDALETCDRLAEVEERLGSIQRRAAMLLFAIEGGTGARAVYECDCRSHFRLPDAGRWIAGTNHRRAAAAVHPSSRSRFDSLNRIVATLHQQQRPIVQGLIDLLADRHVEQRADASGTVYSVVACPQTGELHFTFGGFPAASRGHWKAVPWPWDDSS